MSIRCLPRFALIAIVGSLVVGASGCSKCAKPDAAAVVAPPAIQYPEQSHDFGQVREGAKLVHVFAVRNVGGSALHIDQVRSSCGCTAAILKGNDIAPGREGQIEVSYDTRHTAGDQRKTVTVASNDPSHPETKLEIRANIEVALGFDPSFIQLQSEPGKDLTIETWLLGTFKEQAQLKILEQPTERELSVRVVGKRLDQGGDVLGLRFDLSGKKAGFGSGHVTVETGLAYPDTMQIGYTWTVAGNITVTPVHLLFSAAQSGSRGQVLQVTSRNADFKLRAARVVSGPFVASIEPPKSGVDYQVHVALSKGHTFTAKNVVDAGKLELVSNDRLEPKKEVRLKFAP